MNSTTTALSIRRRLPLALLGAFLATVALSGPAFAIGDDSAGTPTCPKGKIWDPKSKKCVVEHGSLVPDKDRTDYAYALAKDGRYDEALAMLDTLKNPATAEALNYRGYATRKLGRTDEGIGYYLKSIAMAPHYASAREYLGEAYLTKGQTDLAKEQLKIIETICGKTCEEYLDLAEAIEKSPKS